MTTDASPKVGIATAEELTIWYRRTICMSLLGASPTETMLFYLVAVESGNKPFTQRGMADVLQVPKSTVSRIVQDFTKMGAMNRTRHGYCFTPYGLEVFFDFERQTHKIVHGYQKGYRPDSIRVVQEARKLAGNSREKTVDAASAATIRFPRLTQRRVDKLAANIYEKTQ